MKPAVLLAMTSIQLIGQTTGSTPKIVYEEVTKQNPGLLPSPDFEPQIGKPIYPFDVKDLTGRNWKLSELKGKVVYLNIWFIGCPPCVQEMPSLNALFDEFGGKNDTVMLSITFDNPADLNKFTAAHPIKLPLASVSFDQIKQLASVGGTISFPTHLIIDREGNLAVASRGGGSQIHSQLRHSIKSVISRPVSVANK